MPFSRTETGSTKTAGPLASSPFYHVAPQARRGSHAGLCAHTLGQVSIPSGFFRPCASDDRSGNVPAPLWRALPVIRATSCEHLQSWSKITLPYPPPYMGSSLCSAQSGCIKRLAGGVLLCILKCFKPGYLGSMRRCELSRRGSAYTHLKGCRTLFCQLSCVWRVSQVSMPYRRDFQRNQNLVRSVETPVTILH